MSSELPYVIFVYLIMSFKLSSHTACQCYKSIGTDIYIIINVLSPWFGFGRAIAHWNRLGIITIDHWEIFASRAPRAFSTRKCVFLQP